MSYDFLFSTSKFHLQKACNFQVFTMWILGSYEHILCLYLLRIFVNAKFNNKILATV